MHTIRIFLPVMTAVLALGLVSMPASAQQNKPVLEKNLLSIGAGVSRNEVNSHHDTGFQVIGAYDLPEVTLVQGVNSLVEIGYMDFGFDRDDTGLWGSFVIDSNFSDSLGWLAQAGLDIGDDSGFMFGAGLKVIIDSKSDLRFEYVVRDEVDSLQVNFLFHL